MAQRPELVDVAGRQVAISNPSKVYFPERGYTKLDLVRYYLAVSEGALRGAGGRPMALKRFVNGVTGDYSRGAAGFVVRNGEIAEPVAEITIASNLLAMFATLEPGSDLEFRRGLDAPTLLVPEMTVAAS